MHTASCKSHKQTTEGWADLRPERSGRHGRERTRIRQAGSMKMKRSGRRMLKGKTLQNDAQNNAGTAVLSFCACMGLAIPRADAVRCRATFSVCEAHLRLRSLRERGRKTVCGGRLRRAQAGHLCSAHAPPPPPLPLPRIKHAHFRLRLDRRCSIIIINIASFDNETPWRRMGDVA